MRTCSLSDCEKKLHSQKYCSMHQARMKRYGTTDLPAKEVKVCKARYCRKVVWGRGWRHKHYQRYWKGLDPEAPTVYEHPEVCSVEGCDREYSGKGFCKIHYDRSFRQAPGHDRVKPPDHGFSRRNDTGKHIYCEYTTWLGIKQRCNNPKNKDYKHYGGRGIKICEEWSESFEAFYEYIGPRPEGMSIDRIDVNGNYEPGNVRWATAKEQRNNQRKKEGNKMASLIENIDKEIRAAKASRKELDKEIKALEQAKLALQGLGKKKTTKSVKAAKKAEKVAEQVQDNIREFIGGNG